MESNTTILLKIYKKKITIVYIHFSTRCYTSSTTTSCPWSCNRPSYSTFCSEITHRRVWPSNPRPSNLRPFRIGRWPVPSQHLNPHLPESRRVPRINRNQPRRRPPDPTRPTFPTCRRNVSQRRHRLPPTKSRVMKVTEKRLKLFQSFPFIVYSFLSLFF